MSACSAAAMRSSSRSSRADCSPDTRSSRACAVPISSMARDCAVRTSALRASRSERVVSRSASTSTARGAAQRLEVGAGRLAQRLEIGLDPGRGRLELRAGAGGSRLELAPLPRDAAASCCCSDVSDWSIARAASFASAGRARPGGALDQGRLQRGDLALEIGHLRDQPAEALVLLGARRLEAGLDRARLLLHRAHDAVAGLLERVDPPGGGALDLGEAPDQLAAGPRCRVHWSWPRARARLAPARRRARRRRLVGARRALLGGPLPRLGGRGRGRRPARRLGLGPRPHPLGEAVAAPARLELVEPALFALVDVVVRPGVAPGLAGRGHVARAVDDEARACCRVGEGLAASRRVSHRSPGDP